MRRTAALLTAVAAGAAGLLVLPAQADETASAEWTGRSTLLSGTSRYDRGEWIHTDYVYDDYGANTGAWGQPNVVSLAGTTGDARYPTGARYADNAADIVEVRARVAGDDLEFRVLLQTIVDPEVPAVWVSQGGTHQVFTAKNADIDAGANTVAFRLPRAAGAATATLTVGAGLHDGSGGLRAGRAGNRSAYPNDYTTGGPTDNRLFDLAFNSRDLEPRGAPWNEDAQSAALADGNLAPFAQTIDIAKLRAGATTEVDLRPGYYVRLFESRMNLGEGIGNSFPQYRGRWQPYALWVPNGYDPARPGPLFLNLHSLSVHHNQYRGGTSPTYRTLYEQLGDGLGAVVATPLGRGPDGWYLNEAFVDTLEVWADARRSFAVDPERTVISGYSMGGYGTYRFTTLMPDSFASAVSVVGPPTNGIWTGLDTPTSPYHTYNHIESTRNVPFWITHGVADELVPVYGVQRQADRFATLAHEHRFALHPAADHFTFSAQDNWEREKRWFASHPVRVANPQHVTLKVRPASRLSADRAALVPLLETLLAEVGARVDGAYWVGDVRVAGTGDVTAVVDLQSGGIARRRTGTEQILTAGIDGPSPHRLTGVKVNYADAPTTDTLTGSLTNVSAITVDVGRAGLSDRPTVNVQSATPITITFVRDGVVVGTATAGPAAGA